MKLFFVIAALLLVAALLFVLPPLLRQRHLAGGVARGALNVDIYRDQLRELDADLASGALSPERHDEAKRDIERRLIEESGEGTLATGAPRRSRGMAAAVGLLVPALALLLYFTVGDPGALLPQKPQPAGIDPQQFVAMVDKLATRLKEKPDDPEAWVMLGRSYGVLGRYPEAAIAYGNAASRMPGNAQVLTDQAEMVGMAQGGKLQGEPEALIERALMLDPEHVKALALLGTVAFEKQDFVRAANVWEKTLKLAPPDSEFATSMKANVEEARTRAKSTGAPAVAAAPPTPAGQSEQSRQSGPRIVGVVTLSPTLAARVSPGDTVFIFARATEGSRMPLAILRKRADELPIHFVLDDSLAMSPAANLSSAAQVVVGARISKAGEARAQSGDFEGYSAPLKPGAGEVSITIDAEVR